MVVRVVVRPGDADVEALRDFEAAFTTETVFEVGASDDRFRLVERAVGRWRRGTT